MKIGREFDKIGRIDGTNPIQTDRKTAGAISSAGPSAPKDIVQISDKAKEYSVGKNLVKAALNKAEENAGYDRLLKLKREIQNRTYNVPGDTIAAALFGISGKTE
jgi:anti-sigma28 factor (negative regulator of flagellin synthesis)